MFLAENICHVMSKGKGVTTGRVKDITTTFRIEALESLGLEWKPSVT
jgi:hypothetical protein